MSEPAFALLKEKIIKTDAVINLLAEKNSKVTQLQKKLQFLFEKFVEKSKEAETLNQKVCVCIAEHEPLRKRVAELEAFCTDLQTKYDTFLNTSEVKFQSVNKELEILKKKNEELLKANEKLKRRVMWTKSKKKNDVQEDEIDLLKTENELLSTQVDKLTERCDNEFKERERFRLLLNKVESNKEHDEETNQLKEQIYKLEITEAELRNEVEILKMERSKLLQEPVMEDACEVGYIDDDDGSSDVESVSDLLKEVIDFPSAVTPFDESCNEEMINESCIGEMIDFPSAVTPFDESCSEAEDCLGFAQVEIKNCAACIGRPVISPKGNTTNIPPCQSTSSNFDVLKDIIEVKESVSHNKNFPNNKRKCPIRKRKYLMKMCESDLIKRVKLAVSRDMLKFMVKYFKMNLKSVEKLRSMCCCKRKSKSVQFRRNKKLLRLKVQKLREFKVDTTESENDDSLLKHNKCLWKRKRINRVKKLSTSSDEDDGESVNNNLMVQEEINNQSGGHIVVETKSSQGQVPGQQETKRNNSAGLEKNELEVLSQDSGYARSDADNSEMELRRKMNGVLNLPPPNCSKLQLECERKSPKTLERKRKRSPNKKVTVKSISIKTIEKENCQENFDSPLSPDPENTTDIFLLSPKTPRKATIYDQVIINPKQKNSAGQIGQKRVETIPRTSFKRPNCAKRPKTNSTPPAISSQQPTLQPSTTTPSTIATQQPIKKICKMKPGRAKVLFRKLLTFINDSTIVEEVAKEFSTQTKEHICQLILEEVCLYPLQKIDTQYTPPAPLLNQIQRILLGLMRNLNESSMPSLFETFLCVAEKRILVETNVQHLVPITNLYVAVCKLKKDLDRMRRMVCDGFYFMGDFAVPFLFNVLISWIEILPLQSESTEDMLVKVLIQIINLKTCNIPGYNLLTLRNLLKTYYGYPNERWNSDEVFYEVFTSYLGNPTNSTELAILILCKNLPAKWIVQQVNAHVKSAIVSAENPHLKIKLVDLMRRIVKQLDSAAEKKDLETWLNTQLQGVAETPPE